MTGPSLAEVPQDAPAGRVRDVGVNPFGRPTHFVDLVDVVAGRRAGPRLDRREQLRAGLAGPAGANFSGVLPQAWKIA